MNSTSIFLSESGVCREQERFAAGTGLSTESIQRALAGQIVHEQIRLRYGDLQGKYASQERPGSKIK